MKNGHLQLTRFFSLVIIFTTLSLIALGGYVHNTEASLACPDWPMCYGSFFPKMEGGILFEHGHRLMGALVGLFNIVLVVLTYMNAKKKELDPLNDKAFSLSVLTLFLVIVQGMLGGLTVIYRLPTIVSTSHLALALVYLFFLVRLDHAVADHKQRVESQQNRFFHQLWNPVIKHYLFIAGGIIYLQSVLGAFMRHAGAGASCGLGPNAWHLCLDVTTWNQTWWPTSPAAEVHMAHRYFALVASVVVIYALIRLIWFLKAIAKAGDGAVLSGRLYLCAVLAFVFLLAQVSLGVLTVYYNLTPLPTTLHLVFAALLLLVLWKAYLYTEAQEQIYSYQTSYSWISDIFELVKPRLAALVMMTVLIGVVAAPGHINFFLGLFSLLLIFLLVAGATTLNCYQEREIDAKMERTKDRALAAGRISPRFALWLGRSLIVISFFGLGFYVNWITALLGLSAALLYLFAYTPLKQKTPYAVYVGAIPGAIPPMMGWTTVTGGTDTMAWLLFLILVVWQIPHFMAISIRYGQDYKAANIQVFPNVSGLGITKWGITLFSLLLLVISILPGWIAGASTAYTYIAAMLGLALVLYALRVFALPDELIKIEKWAKRYFYATVAYLPLLLGSLIFIQ